MKKGTHVTDEGDCPGWCPACRRQKAEEAMNAPTISIDTKIEAKAEDIERVIEATLNDVQRRIAHECDELKKFLLAKNIAYGNSALDPVRIFSQASAEEQLLVRIDDKLSRIKRGHAVAQEDTTKDLIGYLVLLRICRGSRD
jgi:hypothetical protein